MSRIRFQQQLEDLRSKLLVMAGLAEQAVGNATASYQSRSIEQATKVFRTEPEINALEREIDRMAFDLLATEQPMAVDLRFILSVIRINSDLERVGDQAVNIAARIQDVDSSPEDLPVDIPKLATLSAQMIRKAVQSFIDADPVKADEVLKLDDEVDRLNSEAFTRLSALIEQQPNRTAQALGALVVARNLERIGDHATNIAEDVIFWIRGSDVRHNFQRTQE